MNATAPAVRVAALTIDCAGPAALAEFWGKVLARPVSPGATPEIATLGATDPASGPQLDGSAGIKQVLLPTGGGAQGDSR